MKFLYLEFDSYVTPWVDGGEIPLSLASKYRAVERNGTQTPDENIIRNLRGMDDSAFEQNNLVVEEGGPAIGITVHFAKITRNGKLIGENVRWSQDFEDGLVLCFSDEKSEALATRLGKVACVQILDVEGLFETISTQLGLTGRHGPCEYTNTKNRDVFLKSSADEWQHEYRLYWNHKANARVTLPSGVAMRVNF